MDEDRLKMEIKEVEWGIANRFNDGTIEINKNLKKYPKLYYPILRHELGHDDSLISMKNLKHDLIPDEKINQLELIKFMFKYKKSFTQLLPFYYSRKRGFILDINLTLMYLFLLATISVIIKFSINL